MIFTGIFKPKWQHRNPEIRLKAVQALTSGETDILTSIVREDESPAVRRLALRRIDDLALIHSVSNDDSDKNIRESARTRLLQLVAGTKEQCPALDVRLDFISGHTDPDLLEFVALSGVESELRKVAQGGVTRETVLRDIAIKDTVIANRMAALERITEPSVLEAVFRQTRKSDKKISREARTRLDAMREAEERPARIKAECEQVCSRMEALVKGQQWQVTDAELQSLDSRWQAIADETDAASQTRYALAREAFMQASADFRQAREAEERHWADIRAVKQELLMRMEQCQVDLLATSALSSDADKEQRAELESWRTTWDQAEKLPAEQALSLNEQFTRIESSIRQRLGSLRDSRQMEEAIVSLLKEAERMRDAKRPITEQQVKSLEKRWNAHGFSAGTDRLVAATQSFEKIKGQLHERLVHQREQRNKEFEKLPGMLDQLESQLQEKHLKEAGPMHDRIHNSLNHLQALGLSKEQLAPSAQRLHDMTPQVRELQSWRTWGADEARERLCNEIEALIGSEISPGELATEIRRLRNEWNLLQSDGSANGGILRKRFNNAASEAYKPCEVFFKQQSEERAGNLEAKQGLLEKLESYLASLDWSHMDWKAGIKMQRQFSNDWRQAGPVDRRKGKEIDSRYHAAMGVLKEHFDLEHERNLVQRNALIEQVRGLLTQEDINKAIDECKKLQAQWHTTVPGKRDQENAIWQEFREACDAVFARRQQQMNEHHEIEKQNLAKKQQLCETIEQLSQSGIAELHDMERQLHKLLDEWKEIGPVAKRDSAGLEKRFEAARHGFHAHAAALREKEAQAQLAHLRDKALICTELERLLEHPDPATARSELDGLEKQWSEAPSLRDAAIEQSIRQRYEKVRDALMQGEDQLTQLLTELQANLDSRKEICLRMEILTGVESPPDALQARMEFQANRLAEAIGQGVEDPVGKLEELELDWYLSGGAPAAEQSVLQQRFEKARKTDKETPASSA